MPYHRATQRCSEQTALARQDLSCTYLAQHELDSVVLIIILIIDDYRALGVHTSSSACQIPDKELDVYGLTSKSFDTTALGLGLMVMN